MKGYRKLRAGEKIKRGDAYILKDSCLVFNAECTVGEKFNPNNHIKHYRQIKKVRRRIKLSKIVGQAIWDAIGSGLSRSVTTRELTEYIVKLVQNNYRRRKKA